MTTDIDSVEKSKQALTNQPRVWYSNVQIIFGIGWSSTKPDVLVVLGHFLLANANALALLTALGHHDMVGQVVLEQSSVSKCSNLCPDNNKSELLLLPSGCIATIWHKCCGILQIILSSSSPAKKNALGVWLVQGVYPEVVFCIIWDFVPTW